MTSEENQAIRTARSLIDLGHSVEAVLASTFIPLELRAFVRAELDREKTVLLRPARLIVADRNLVDWVTPLDRSEWHYWPTLRHYLLAKRGWDQSAVRSIDDSSDKVLRLVRPPADSAFDVRGLVLGYVQSGKTANFTALCAKAADAGYRLLIVLSGLDNGLRRQTNIRLKKELTGFAETRVDSVPLPPVGLRWHEFTRPEINGDFNAGAANHAALQGSQPVLLVVKKTGPVLRRLRDWLGSAPADICARIPTLVIDDEADLASVDTRGTRQAEVEEVGPDYEPPSIINGLIRELLARFSRCAYVAYTATPFANVLIPHDTWDPAVKNDLYPKDFIVDLPKPNGYFGFEEVFGRVDASSGAEVGGLDCIREVDDQSLLSLETGVVPASLGNAILDFVLAGAAKAVRQPSDGPATMLVHTSHLIAEHAPIKAEVSRVFGELRDEWRYQRSHGVRERLQRRWEAEFRPVTRASHLDRDLPFEALESALGPFMEAVQILEMNSEKGDVLDYDREPNLKAIAVGGNRLSRGLTLESLLTSYFVRRSATYDTLMQMGRWCGFRSGYEDLTRIYTTRELAGWFSDLASVEHRLREDIKVYESLNLTPYEVGIRIWQHPAMQVTAPLKRRFATSTTVTQTYSLALEQTFRFPLSRLEDLAEQAELNVQALKGLAGVCGTPNQSLSTREGPVWTGVPAEHVLAFLESYEIDESVRSLSIPLISEYVMRCVADGELTDWTIAVRGLGKPEAKLGTADWGLPGGPISLISRTRLSVTDSIGALVDPKHESIGLPGDLTGIEARRTRAATSGLLVIYPISRFSGYKLKPGTNRRPLYEEPSGPLARDLIGIAFSLPESRRHHVVEAFLQGSAPGVDELPSNWVPSND